MIRSPKSLSVINNITFSSGSLNYEILFMVRINEPYTHNPKIIPI